MQFEKTSKGPQFTVGSLVKVKGLTGPTLSVTAQQDELVVCMWWTTCEHGAWEHNQAQFAAGQLEVMQ